MSIIQTQLTKEERSVLEMLSRLARAGDEFEAYAHPHAERVAWLADETAKRFGLGDADRATLRWAALGHDLGELAMNRDYIKSKGPLGEDERIDLARHPVIGEQEIARVGAGRGAQLLVRWHHEWWDGTGYPDALRREQIPLSARILRVADAYAALTDARPFRPARTEEEARQHLTQGAGLEFDPRVVRAFLSLQGAAELRSHARAETPTEGLSPVCAEDRIAAAATTGGEALMAASGTGPAGPEGTNARAPITRMTPSEFATARPPSNLPDDMNHA